MAQCPKCSAAVSDDFGLIECASCGAQLIVHIDGTVQHNDAAADESILEEITSSFVEESPEYEAPAVVDDFAAEDPPAYEPVAEYEDAPSDEFAAEDANTEDGVTDDDVVEDTPAYDEPAAPEPSLDELFGDAPAAEVSSASETSEPVYRVANDSPDLSDIAQFGNSGVSSARDGSLRYVITISGIDTADVREAFREALTDRKFVWDTDELLRSIRNGELRLTDVSATKAYVLISRLRTLPVEVEWEQYAITQA